MPRLIGIDEAGYGPNLGPLVQVAVAVRIPEDGCLWQRLHSLVRRGNDPDDGRLLIDDSKVVYMGPAGLERLELGVLTCCGNRPLGRWFTADFSADGWFDPGEAAPVAADPDALALGAECWKAAQQAGVEIEGVEVAVTPARQFNRAVDQHGSKAAVLADGVASLVRAVAPAGPARFVIDKHGGRHFYAAFVQSMFPDAWVTTLAEAPDSSRYCVGEQWEFEFRPRAEQYALPVALASMTAKYLRERCMRQFNRYWQTHVPGLPPTAGYPGDAKRYYDAIRPAMKRLGICRDDVWRKR